MDQIRSVGKGLDRKEIRRIRGFQPASFFPFFSLPLSTTSRYRYSNWARTNRRENCVKFKLDRIEFTNQPT